MPGKVKMKYKYISQYIGRWWFSAAQFQAIVLVGFPKIAFPETNSVPNERLILSCAQQIVWFSWNSEVESVVMKASVKDHGCKCVKCAKRIEIFHFTRCAPISWDMIPPSWSSRKSAEACSDVHAIGHVLKWYCCARDTKLRFLTTTTNVWGKAWAIFKSP